MDPFRLCLALGPVATSVLAIASAMTVAILLEELRGGPEAEAADRGSGEGLDPGVLHGYRAGGAHAPDGSAGVGRADREYEDLRKSLEEDDRDTLSFQFADDCRHRWPRAVDQHLVVKIG